MSKLRRVAVLGLDGVPFSLLKILFARGLMPRLEETARAGTFLQMETSIPPVSSVAWASFMTGKDPGHHGIFGFTDLARDEIALRLPSFDDLRAPAVWQVLRDRTSVIVNLPFTYPARPVNGVLISGFVAPVFERSVHPQSLIPWLKSRNYRIDVDAVKGRTDRGGLVKELFENLSVLEEVSLELIRSRPWDLFIGVVTGTDRLHHFFFDASEDASHPYNRDFIDYYRRIDSFFGRLSTLIGTDTRLIVLSDHGFTRLRTQVYLNHILRTRGYLMFKRTDPVSLDDVDPRSLAVAMDPARIYLNSKDRFRKGFLSSSAASEVRARLKRELQSMTLADIGIADALAGDPAHEPLFAEVRLKEDLYSGECLPLAPDLVVIPRAGYDPKASIYPPAATMTDIFTGMHTHDDAVLIVNDPTVAGTPAQPRITDVARLVLEVLS